MKYYGKYINNKSFRKRSGCQADVYVARYEVYPNVDPTGVCVGFRTVCSPNGLSGYWDTVVPNADIKEGDDPNAIAGYAWNV